MKTFVELVALFGCFIGTFKWAETPRRGAVRRTGVVIVALLYPILFVVGAFGLETDAGFALGLIFAAAPYVLVRYKRWRSSSGRAPEIARYDTGYSKTLAYPISDTYVAPVPRGRADADDVLDVIRFDYRDRDGKPSSRTVEVTGLDDNYFEGWCKQRRAVRSFRLDRVIGDVVSMGTGEVRSPEEWAGDFLDHPDNHGIDDSVWY